MIWGSGLAEGKKTRQGDKTNWFIRQWVIGMQQQNCDTYFFVRSKKINPAETIKKTRTKNETSQQQTTENQVKCGKMANLYEAKIEFSCDRRWRQNTFDSERKKNKIK